MRFVAPAVALMLGGCATAPETHGRWYVGVAIVVIVAVIALVGEALVRRADRYTVNDTDKEAC